MQKVKIRSACRLSMGPLYNGAVCCRLSRLPEEVCGHAQPDHYDASTQDGLRNLPREARRRISADCACDHGEQAVAPDNLAIDHEKHKRDSVRHCGGDNFERVDLIQVLVAEERKKSDDQKAGAGTEVA